jgi:hypothetical protein
MKKRLLAASILLAVLAAGASAQNLTNVVNDLNTVLRLLGDEVTPYILQGNIAGEGVGTATPPSGKWYFAISAGSVLSGGPFAFVTDERNFEVLDVDGLFSTALDDAGALANDWYERAKGTGGFFPIPGLRLTVGLPNVGGNELIFLFSMFPQAAVDLAQGLIDLDKVVFNRLNVGVRLRHSLVKEGGGFPAITAGFGYTFSLFNAGVSMPSDFSQDIGGQPLVLEGDLLVTSMVNAAGIDLGVSKKLGAFVPFFRLSSYLTWVHYKGEIKDFYAALGDPVPLAETNGPVDASLDAIDLFTLFSGGFEIQAGGFALVTTASYSFDSNAPGVTIATRWQF